MFYWRHKLLAALQHIHCAVFEGVVETDETYFLYSEKEKRNIVGRKSRERDGSSSFRGISKEQVCVLVARDRQKTTYSSLLGMRRIVKSRLDKAIGEYLASDSILLLKHPS
ncbi:hypothetical protein QUF88_08460 [Bacillus sp. DX1.1]|uniref:hypothetical protein n=1 Tax=unclassified Bacillus (in: firmicutes) TaxID=185979 RepID=UPI0025706ADE|nr:MULTISPECIES: hypothetical protein [unclassified Bacillus (in: firmicutes)]MDM5153859.1 hypothetical protein [Bacillus sp. DX1.1]WJE82794.1 hypothetical protein QRE67_05965 [Bacillus sp. DX3.1]